jgi:Tfp pilus assembly protein PilF
LLFEYGRFEEAHEALRHLVTLVPQDASAWHNLGMAAMQLGHDDEAVECLERSVALRPDYLLTENALQSARQGKTAAGNKVGSTDRVIVGLVTPAQEVLPMAG